MPLKLLFTVVCLLQAHFLWAKELVIISDLDETLRVANIEKKPKAGVKLIEGVKAYEGLVLIFNEIKEMNPAVKIYYLSNSYPFLYNGKRWIRENGLPEGVVLQRKLDDKSLQFKPTKLREIRATHPAASFLMFGDNVEHDPDFYREFIKETPYNEVRAFIRDALLIFPQEQNLQYYQHEAQLINMLNISDDTSKEITTLPFEKLVPSFLLKNLRRRLIKECRNALMNCKDAAERKTNEVRELLQVQY
jgi:phosphatidate phosphatase APP1